MTRGYFSNYCGLGGAGSTQHDTDDACRKHDIIFEEVLKIGGEPYLHYVKGDTEFLKELMSKPAKSFKEQIVKEISSAYAAFKHLLPASQVDMPAKLRGVYEDENGKLHMDIERPTRKPFGGDILRQEKRQQLAIANNPVTTRPTTRLFKNTSPNAIETPQAPRAQRDLTQEFEFVADPTSKFNWEALSNLNRNTNMDSADVEMAQAARSSEPGTSTARQTSQETPIIYKTPVYHLPNTHTCILPTTFWASAVLSTDYDALDFIIRLNDYKEPLQTLLSPKPANVGGGNVGAQFTKGLYNRKIPRCNNYASNATSANTITGTSTTSLYTAYNAPNTTRWTADFFTFPMTLNQGSQPLCKMAPWYEKLYDYYTVIGCEYEIIIEGIRDNSYVNSDIVVGSTLDTYSTDPAKTQNNKTGNNQMLADCMYWKNFATEAYLNGKNSDPQSRYKIIKGTHKTGEGTTMVENDGDANRWTRTSSSISADKKLLEDKHFMLWPHPFSTHHEQLVIGYNDAGTGTAVLQNRTCVNMQINLKYIVQFKDLKQTLREFTQVNASSFALLYDNMAVSTNQVQSS